MQVSKYSEESSCVYYDQLGSTLILNFGGRWARFYNLCKHFILPVFKKHSLSVLNGHLNPIQAPDFIMKRCRHFTSL